MPDERTPISLNESAPDFELPATNGDTFRLSSLRGVSGVVLVFLRNFT